MIHNILVAMDGSDRSELSLRWVQCLFENPRITLLRVVEYVHTMPQYMEVVMEQRRTLARKYLEGVAKRMTPEPTTLIHEGSAAHEILEVADETSAELLALTTHGGGKLRRRILGGTTEKLLHGSEIPLLVVPSWQESQVEAQVRKILVPLDGSETSEAILPLARWVARQHQATMVLAHVVSDTHEVEKRLDEVHGWLDRIEAGLRQEAMSEKSVVRAGEVSESLLEVANLEEVDLIVMSAHGYGGMKRMLLGSTASKIIRETPVPVLVARRAALKRFASSPP